jgi:hypothetical protein
MQAKPRRGDDMGPKPKRARPSHEDAMYDDNDESDADTSVHDFRRVQIIHKPKKRRMSFSASLASEDKEMARKRTKLQELPKTERRIQANDWEVHKNRIKELIQGQFGLNELASAVVVGKTVGSFISRKTGTGQRSSSCLRSTRYALPHAPLFAA